MNDSGHWICDAEIDFDAFGFIYEITNKLTNKKYIGKKQMIFKRRKKLRKGKVNRQIVVKESDWKSYTGSNNDLNADIKIHGKESFEFKILRFCKGKWELSYFEIAEQISREVLLRDDYYNGIINCRLGRLKKK